MLALDSGRNRISTLPLPVSEHFLSVGRPGVEWIPHGMPGSSVLAHLRVFNNVLSGTLHHPLTFIFATLGFEPRDLFIQGKCATHLPKFITLTAAKSRDSRNLQEDTGMGCGLGSRSAYFVGHFLCPVLYLVGEGTKQGAQWLLFRDTDPGPRSAFRADPERASFQPP